MLHEANFRPDVVDDQQTKTEGTILIWDLHKHVHVTGCPAVASSAGDGQGSHTCAASQGLEYAPIRSRRRVGATISAGCLHHSSQDRHFCWGYAPGLGWYLRRVIPQHQGTVRFIRF